MIFFLFNDYHVAPFQDIKFKNSESIISNQRISVHYSPLSKTISTIKLTVESNEREKYFSYNMNKAIKEKNGFIYVCTYLCSDLAKKTFDVLDALAKVEIGEYDKNNFTLVYTLAISDKSIKFNEEHEHINIKNIEVDFCNIVLIWNFIPLFSPPLFRGIIAQTASEEYAKENNITLEKAKKMVEPISEEKVIEYHLCAFGKTYLKYISENRYYLQSKISYPIKYLEGMPLLKIPYVKEK